VGLISLKSLNLNNVYPNNNKNKNNKVKSKPLELYEKSKSPSSDLVHFTANLFSNAAEKSEQHLSFQNDKLCWCTLSNIFGFVVYCLLFCGAAIAAIISCETSYPLSYMAHGSTFRGRGAGGLAKIINTNFNVHFFPKIECMSISARGRIHF
jgi:hypothetical protein